MICPVNDNVLVKVDSSEVKSPGGLLLTATEEVALSTGVVQAIGDHSIFQEYPALVPGAHVRFEREMGYRFKLPRVETLNGFSFTREDEFIVVSAMDVIAVMEG